MHTIQQKQCPFHIRKWKDARGDKCERFRLLKKSVRERTLCLADAEGSINPNGGSVNTTKFNERYSDSVFDQDQKEKILKKYKNCVKKAGTYMEDNGANHWETWQKRQTE